MINGQTIREMIFWGATGQAKVLKECMKDSGLKLIALFDNNTNLSPPFEDIPLYFGKEGFENWISEKKFDNKIGFLVAIEGDNGLDRIKISRYPKVFSIFFWRSIISILWNSLLCHSPKYNKYYDYHVSVMTSMTNSLLPKLPLKSAQDF